MNTDKSGRVKLAYQTVAEMTFNAAVALSTIQDISKIEEAIAHLFSESD